MKKDQTIFIKHILENIDDIKNFTKNVSKEEFENSKIIQNAVIRSLEVIGEAVKNIDESFRKKHSKIEWKKIAGTRDKIIHHYFGVDLEIVWEIVKQYLPELKENLEEIIKKDLKKR